MPKGPRRLRRAFYKVDDIAADTWFILLDKSGAAAYNWPSGVDSFTIMGIDIATEKASDGRYDIHIGCVLENDATDGTAQWLRSWFLDADGNATDGTDRFVDRISFVYPGVNIDQGIDCSVVGGATDWLVGTASGNQTALQNDAANLGSCGDATADKSAAAGDIVVFIDEGTTGGTISVAIGIDYVVN